MKKTGIIVYGVALITNVIANLFDVVVVANVTKVLLMPTLAFIFITAKGNLDVAVVRWTLFALLFSWFGDIFLMFQTKHGNFFLLGLASFLIAHICYIFDFRKARSSANQKVQNRSFMVVLLLAIYLTSLFILIGPGLGSFAVPVILYAITISSMLFVSYLRIGKTSKSSFILVLIGASTFVLSDSMIALNKFWIPFYGAGAAIMLTYGIAQFVIIQGLISHSKK